MSILIHNGEIYGTSGYTLADMINGTLQSGETEVVFSDAMLTPNSIIDVYVDDSVLGTIYPTAVDSSVTGKCTVTFNEAPEEDVTVAIKLTATSEYMDRCAALINNLYAINEFTITTDMWEEDSTYSDKNMEYCATIATNKYSASNKAIDVLIIPADDSPCFSEEELAWMNNYNVSCVDTETAGELKVYTAEVPECSIKLRIKGEG